MANVNGQDIDQLDAALATETFVDNAVSEIITNVDGGSASSTYSDEQTLDGGGA